MLKKQQEELGKFMEYSSIKEKLDTFRKENGFPRVLDLVENVERIKVLRDGGVSIFCFVEENQPSSTRVLFNYLEYLSINEDKMQFHMKCCLHPITSSIFSLPQAFQPIDSPLSTSHIPSLLLWKREDP